MMDKTPFFSIVMPVYNVEPHLKKAIESMLGQTFTDFEIILVNDCSPDNSVIICREYEEKCGFITVVEHEVNKGLSAARNSGFEKVRGEYVLFFDSDDYVDCDLLQNVYDSLMKNRADAVVYGCVEEYYDKKGLISKTVEIKPTLGLYSSSGELRRRVLDLELNTLYGYAWNKFYSVKHIREKALRYENIVLIEDIKFNVEFFNNINSLNVLDIAPYHYAKRGTTSLTAKFVPNYYEVHRERVRLLYNQHKNWGILGDDEKRIIANIYVRYIFSALSRNCDDRANMSHKERKKWIKGVFSDELFCELIEFAKASSRQLSVMGSVLKKRSVFCSLALGRVIYIVQNNFKRLFIRSKQGRN